MEKLIAAEIAAFVHDNPGNRRSDGKPFFEEPLIGIAAADDPLFASYKDIIGAFHLTPQEMMEAELGGPVRAASVICWVLPIHRSARESNRQQDRWPSREWSHTRNFGEAFNGSLRRHIVEWLAARGHQAVAPQLAKTWQELPDTPVGVASTWSDRHAAFAAGLGTFSLNDALITPKGIAHRIGSVITDLSLQPSPGPSGDYRHNCLFYREGTCGICIERCPIGAISKNGHDKTACRGYVYTTIPEAVATEYGVTATGCGLCQTKVPCEAMIPRSIGR